MKEIRQGLKPGETFKIRLLPREIMACVAITERVLPSAATKNLSLAQCVRIAITELCEAAIKSKAIKEPEEFNYQQSIASYRRAPMARKVTAGQLAMQVSMERASATGIAALGGMSFEPQDDGPLVITEEDRRRSAEAVKRALASGAVEESGATVARRTTRARIDPRKLRFDELKFKSENNAENMEPREFKEMRRLARELGVTVAV